MKTYNTTKPAPKYAVKQYENAIYLGWTVPKSIPEDQFDLNNDNVVQHFNVDGREVTVTRPAKSRAFWPEEGQLVNVGWKPVTLRDGSVRDLYYCVAVI